MVDRESSPAHFDRPLSDEPWRFRCPECGSSAIDSLDRKRTRRGYDEFSFYCQQCTQKLEFVIDNKTGGKIYGVESDHDGY